MVHERAYLQWEVNEMTSTWYVEGLKNEEEEWFKLVAPYEHLGPDESPFCKCGHHVEKHGYSCLFEDEYFCFAVNPVCMCTGFEPYKKGSSN